MMPKDDVRGIAYGYAVYRDLSERIAMPDKLSIWTWLSLGTS